MSKIEQLTCQGGALRSLVKKLCPDGVEYKPLGEVATIERGNGLQKSDFVESGVPCIHYGQLYTRFNTFATKTLAFVSEKTAAGLKRLHSGDILMAVTSENVEDVCKCIAWLGEGDVVVGGHTAIIRHQLEPKYLAYWFQTEAFFAQKRKLAHGTKVIEVTPSCLVDVVLPVPPIEIQREVVEVLDKFALLEAELEAELAKRKKQYEHYRRALLGGNAGASRPPNEELRMKNEELRIDSSSWPRVKLGEVCEILRGKRLTKSQLANDFNFPVFHGGLEPLGMYSQANRHANMTMVINVGASAGTVGYSTVPFWSSDGCYSLEPNERLNSRYLFHALVCQEINIKSRVRVAGIPTLDKSAVAEVSIPLPPLAEQQRIVAILDRFDALCNSLVEGLPAEIERRKKQYAYYRDKLLAFRRKGGR